MTAEEMRYVMQDDDLVNALTTYMIQGWPLTREEVKENLKPYWSLRDNLAVIDKIAMKGGSIIISTSLQKLALEQPHIRHMEEKKTRLLACDSIYLINKNCDIKNAIKNCPVFLDFQVTQSEDKVIHYEI